LSSVEIWRPCEQDIPALARILHACVHGGASVSFILPFSIEDAAGFWQEKVMPAAIEGKSVVFVAHADGEMAGTVQLVLAMPPNQQHRAEIAKLLVHPNHRGKGVARALMLAAEETARAAGRSLITLDTRTNDLAEALYFSLGYQLAGVLPNYARGPHSPELESTSFLFKILTSR